MLVFHQTRPLSSYLEALAQKSKSTGFVPTMGALHEGHLSLVLRALAENDIVITSIFVNPTQFNDPADLTKYPRMPERDIALLAQAGNHIVFLPTKEEIYPQGHHRKTAFDLGGLDNILEGAFRPEHFKGVAEVVYRLLEITHPDRLYMGQKDFQQVAVIRQLIQSEKLPVHLVMCPTQREAGGLAMSSRNMRLSPKWKKKAPVLYQALRQARTALKTGMAVAKIETDALHKIEAAGLKPEYFRIVDGNTLQPVKSPSKHNFIVAVTAAWAADVRLIDNMVLRQS